MHISFIFVNFEYLKQIRLRPSYPHNEHEIAELRKLVCTYEEQVADSNERLCAKEDELERERLLREELVRKAVDERMQQVKAEAYEKAMADARAEAEKSVAGIRAEAEVEKAEAEAEKAEARRLREEALREKAEAGAIMEEAESRKADADEYMRDAREKLAAEARELKQNTAKIKEGAIREYMERCGNAKDLMFDAFIKSMQQLPGSTPKARKKLMAEYRDISDKTVEAVTTEVKRQLGAAATDSRKKIQQIAYLANEKFGCRSERTHFSQDEWKSMEQSLLKANLLDEEDEARFKEALANHRRAKAILESWKNAGQKPGHGQSPIPESVPVSSKIVLTPKEVTDNPGKYRKLSQTETSTLHRHTSFTRKVVVRQTWVLIDAMANPELKEIVSSELPEGLEPEGKYDNSVRAHVVVSKYVDHIPLARQESMTEREGCRINRSTMDGLVDDCTELYLRPLFPLLEAEVLKSDYIAADGVPMKVVDREKNKTVNRYAVAIRSVLTGAVIFRSHINDDDDGKKKSGRSKKVLLEYLKDWNGVAIMCDGCPSYDWIRELGKTICRCAVHSRREFDKGKRENRNLVSEPIMLFQMIFLVEDFIRQALERREMTMSDVSEYRHTYAEPAWILLKAWCAATLLHVPDGSQVKKACNYLLNHYDELTNYLDIPFMPCHNNDTERVIRSLVMGRKNYLFNQSEQALERDTIIYSFFATCAVNDVDPRRWLEYVMDHFEETPTDRLHTLLPQHWVDVTRQINSSQKN